MADAIAIGAILFLDAVIGFLQESRAEMAALAPRSMTTPRARVLRHGHSTVVPAATIAARAARRLAPGWRPVPHGGHA